MSSLSGQHRSQPRRLIEGASEGAGEGEGDVLLGYASGRRARILPAMPRIDRDDQRRLARLAGGLAAGSCESREHECSGSTSGAAKDVSHAAPSDHVVLPEIPACRASAQSPEASMCPPLAPNSVCHQRVLPL